MSDTPRTLEVLTQILDRDGRLEEDNVPFILVRLAKTLELELNAAKAELIERLRERTEAHLAASARDVQTIQRQSVILERLADAARRCRHWHDTCDGVIISAVSFWNLRSALSAYESANLEPVADPIDEAVRRMEEVPVLELNKIHFDAMDYGNFNDIEAVRARLISAAKGEQP